MDILSVLNFLLPFHILPFKAEFLPLIFFGAIWFLFAWTIYRVYKKAKPENWENNWYAGDKNNTANTLDAEHGSVMDISEAVATPAEKLADIMPGMILILGLLGTFVGLGLALDKASSILTAANAMSNMDTSMTQLMGMLEGLGTKFKTSTWGLLAFILLKVILSKNGYEERRLRWSIEKVKRELDISRNQKLTEERANNQKLINCMQTIAMQFEKTVAMNQSSNKEQLMQLAQFSQNTISAIQDSHQDQSKLLNLIQYNQADHTKMIKYQALTFEKLLGGLSEKYDQMIEGMKVQHQENKTFLNDLVLQGKDTRDAMVDFVEKSEATVNSLGQSAAGMADAASTMGSSATYLQNVIHSLSENLEHSIGDMSGTFKQNISEMSQELKVATKGISDAVGSLSQSVDKTMNDVTNTINKSMDLQTKAQAIFIESTDTLNGYVNEMTGLVNKLSGDIKGGLNAVSDSNRNMINLAKKTDNILASIESLDALKELKPTLDNLANSIQIQKETWQKFVENNIPSNQKNRNNAANKQNRSNNLTKNLFGINKGGINER